MSRTENPRSKKIRPVRLLPVKELISGLLSAGAMLTVFYQGGHSPFGALVVGLISYGGTRLMIGTDPPLPEPGSDGRDEWLTAQRDQRDTETMSLAEGAIRRIRQANVDIPCPELSERLDHLEALATRVVAYLKDNPAKIGEAARFVHLYMIPAAEISERYADTHRIAATPKLEEGYRGFLMRMEETFEKQIRALVDREVFDLSVEIESLQHRMSTERNA